MSDFFLHKFEVESHGCLVGEMTSLLHRAYAPLAEKGMKYLASHQTPEITLSRLNRGESYLAFLEAKLIGTMTLISTQTRSKCRWYNTEGTYLFGQFAIEPSLQGKGFGARMMDFIEARSKKLGARELALDTSEHADQLIQIYSQRGYRFIEYVKWDEVNYRSLVLSKLLAV